MNLKKTLLLLIIVFPKLVNASEYYQIEGICIESDICKREEIRKYNTYTINNIDMGYMEENNEYLKDENDYILKESDEYITVHTNEKKVSEIFFTYLDINFKIYELEIYNNEELLSYTPRLNYYVQFSEKLHDNDLNTYYKHGNSYSYLVLYLDREYDIEDLKIKIYTKAQDNTHTSLNIGGRIELTNNIDRWHIITFKRDNLDIVEEDIEYYKKYKYYKEEKIINNIYLSDAENIIEDDYIIDYIYYKKDVILENNNNIDKDNNNIINISNEKIIKEDNINIEKTKKSEKIIETQTSISNESDNEIKQKAEEIIIKQNKVSYNVESNDVVEKEQKELKNNNKYIIKKETVKKTNKFRIIISILLLTIDFILIIIKRKKNKVESI